MDRNNFDHYVTQHYIKRFFNNRNTIFIGNVHSQELKETSDVSRVMGSENWSLDQDLEDAFSQIESIVSRSFSRIAVEPLAIEGLADSTKRAIAEFIVLHHARSTGIHNSMQTMSEQFNEVMPAVVRDIAPPDYNLNDAPQMPKVERIDSMILGANVAQDFEPIFRMKGCVALQPSAGQEFVLGDNPFVSLSSQTHFYMRGAIFAPETYFWFPLNPRLGLFFADDMGNKILEGKIKLTKASERLTIALNRAEVYLAVDHIAGSRKNLVLSKLRFPNIGSERTRVERFGHSPLIFDTNLAYQHIYKDVVDDLRTQVNRTD